MLPAASHLVVGAGGLAPGQRVETVEQFLAVIHPGDRAVVHGAFEQALHARGELAVDFRVEHSGGNVHWLHDQGRVFTDSAGQPATFTVRLPRTPQQTE